MKGLVILTAIGVLIAVIFLILLCCWAYIVKLKDRFRHKVIDLVTSKDYKKVIIEKDKIEIHSIYSQDDVADIERARLRIVADDTQHSA